MMDQISSLDETLASLKAARAARRFDGPQFEDAVLRHAKDIPSWEIANDLCITVAELDQVMFGLVMTAMKGGRPSNSPSPQPKEKLVLVK